MFSKRTLSLLIAITLFIQMGTTNRVVQAAPQQSEVHASTINSPALSPVNGSTGIASTNLTLSMRFDSAMQVNPGAIGSVRLKKLATNEVVVEIPASSVILTEEGHVASITLSTNLDISTSYYVQVDADVLLSAANEPYLGFADAITWTFTTAGAIDSVKPAVSLLTPADNGTLGSITSSLTIKFNEIVFPGSGSITIRNSDSSIFCTTLVTDPRVVGGGTDSITITPCASLVMGSAYSVQLSPTAFRDASNNYYAGIGESDYSTWNFVVSTDSVVPELTATDPVTDATGLRTSGLVLTGTFNEEVSVAPSATATLNTVVGSNVTSINLTLTRHPSDPRKIVFSLPSGAALSVNSVYYVNIPTNSITDIAGNYYQGILNPYRWSFRTITSNTAAPVLSTVSIDGNALVLTYDQELDPAAIPNVAQYYVSVNTLPRNINSVTVTGKQVKLMLSSGVLVGQVVKVSFTSGILRSLGTIPAASFAAREVTNAMSTVVPSPASGSIVGVVVTLTFNKPLVPLTSTSATSQFRVRMNGNIYNPTVAYTSENSLILVLPTAYQGTGAVSVSYIPGIGGDHLRDANGYAVTTFSEFFIANGDDKQAPILSSGSVTGNKISLIYNEGLRTTTVPPVTSFSVLANGTSVPVSSVTIYNNTVELTMSQVLVTGQNLLVTYVPGTTSISDLSGNLAPIFAGYQLFAGTTSASALTSAVLNGNLIVLNYSTALSSVVVPSSAQYVIRVDGNFQGVNKVSVLGSQVTLTLNAQVPAGRAVKVSYYATGSLLKDATNQTVPAFTDYPVTSSPTGTLPVTLPNYLMSNGKGGVQFNSTAISTQPAMSTNGRFINRYVVNGDYLSSAFIWMKSSGTQLTTPMVTVNVPNTEAAAVVQIPLHALVDASSRVSNGSIKVDYGDVKFELPLSAVKYAQEVSNHGGSLLNSSLEITMEKTTNTKLTNAIGSSSAIILGLPVDFSVKLITAGKQVEVSEFDQYVTRTFVVPVSAAETQSHLSVVRWDDSTGALSYVPTIAVAHTGGIDVNFKRKGSSIYAVVRRGPHLYSDMNNHWASEEVALLASKWIVNGSSATAYSPGKAITRADFAKYITNGLGLTGNVSSAAKFRDVGVNGADAAYIGAASDAGVISGKSNGMFDPNAPITREEMASMMLRAMKYAGVQPSSASLTRFSDESKIGNWAKVAVAACVDAGIITGVTETTFLPKANATRAQAAIMIVRMLQYSELLQD